MSELLAGRKKRIHWFWNKNQKAFVSSAPTPAYTHFYSQV